MSRLGSRTRKNIGAAGSVAGTIMMLLAISACNQTAPMVATSNTNSAAPSPSLTSAFSQFPDIPIPAGANMNVDKTLVFGSTPWFGQLALTTSSNAGLMFDFFRNNLAGHKWQEITSVRAPTSILTYMQENRVLAISIQGSTLGGSNITITVSPKGAGAIKSPTQGTAPQGDLMPIPVTKTPSS
jgi:hypothetical protein